MTLAAGLAAQAAVCIDNARLYDRERRTALALQRSLLPGHPAVPAGLEVAHRYLPVGANIVGGDWHDIIELSGGRAALIVGDAMGHGPEAAAVMIQLRTAAHTLADLELPPEQILGRLDKMAAGLAGAPFATCVYTVIDPAASACVIAQAGHLPPVLALADGTTRVLDLPPGLPLGLQLGSFHATEINLPPGATLALYTDGLVESRTRPFDNGVAALCEALPQRSRDPRWRWPSLRDGHWSTARAWRGRHHPGTRAHPAAVSARSVIDGRAPAAPLPAGDGISGRPAGLRRRNRYGSLPSSAKRRYRSADRRTAAAPSAATTRRHQAPYTRSKS